MILTKYVTYRGKKKKVEDLSPTSGYKVDVQCPVCGEVRNVYYRSVCAAGHTMCQACATRVKRGKTIKKGTKFNRLVVLGSSERSGYSVCECECGTIKDVSNYELKSGGTRSCGCLRVENILEVGHHPRNEKHWNWKGGISGERHIARGRKEYKDWREKVFRKDNHRCQKCGTDEDLQTHHIFNFAGHPKRRLDLDNGTTLCESCHRKLHSIYGLTTNRHQLGEFLSKEGE